MTRAARLENQKEVVEISLRHEHLKTWVVKTKMFLHDGNAHCPESQQSYLATIVTLQNLTISEPNRNHNYFGFSLTSVDYDDNPSIKAATL